MAIEVSNLIEQGYEVNDADQEGTTPLFHIAVAAQVDSCVNVLIGSQAHINAQARDGRETKSGLNFLVPLGD